MLAIAPRGGSFIDSNLLRSFKSLSQKGKVLPGAPPGHKDGWGIIVWLNGRPTYLGRRPTNAAEDPTFDEACNKIDETKVHSHLISHLRKASQGSNKTENTHPFVIDGWAFAHNGRIDFPDMGDKTDSEIFFTALMQEKRKSKTSMKSAIEDSVKRVHDGYDYSSITFLLSDGSELFAYRDYTKNEDYYTMYFTTLRDRFVVSQEKRFESDWHEVPNRRLLHISGPNMNLTSIQ